MKNLSKAAVAVGTAGAVLLGANGAAAAPTGIATTTPSAAISAPTYTASTAFGVAAKDHGRSDAMQPTAIPAIVGTAFVAGAAYGAGKVVAGWAAKKVIGRWDSPTTLQPSMLD